MMLRQASKSMFQLSPSKYFSNIADAINQVYPYWDNEQNRELLSKLIGGPAKILMPSQIQLGSLILTPKQNKNAPQQTEDNKNDNNQSDTNSNPNSTSNDQQQEQPANKPSASELYMSALRPALDYGESLYRLRSPRFVQLAPLKPIYPRPIAMLQPPLATAASAYMSLVEPQLVAASSQPDVATANDGLDSLASGSAAGGAAVVPVVPIADLHQERLIRAVHRARQLEASHRVALVRSSLERDREARLIGPSPVLLGIP